MNVNTLDEQLDIGRVAMLVLLDCVANVEGQPLLDVVEVSTHIESDAVHHLIRLAINNLELDVLQFLTHKFTGAYITHIERHEHGLDILRSEWVEHAHVPHELVIDLIECEFAVNIKLWSNLLSLNVCFNISAQAFPELRDVLFFQRQAYGISVAAEVLEQIACRLDGRIHVKTSDRA